MSKNLGSHNLKKIVFLILLIGSFSSWAQTQNHQCMSVLSRNFTHNMAVFYLRAKELEEYDILNGDNALIVLDVLLKKECSHSVEGLGQALDVECKSFGVNVVCEVRTPIGYFLIHRGSFGHFEHSVVWARWD